MGIGFWNQRGIVKCKHAHPQWGQQLNCLNKVGVKASNEKRKTKKLFNYVKQNRRELWENKMLAGAKFVVININNKEFLTKQQNVFWIFCGFLFCSKKLLILVVHLRHDIIIKITKEQKQH